MCTSGMILVSSVFNPSLIPLGTVCRGGMKHMEITVHKVRPEGQPKVEQLDPEAVSHVSGLYPGPRQSHKKGTQALQSHLPSKLLPELCTPRMPPAGFRPVLLAESLSC